MSLSTSWKSPEKEQQALKNIELRVGHELSQVSRSDLTLESSNSGSATYRLNRTIHQTSPEHQTYNVFVEFQTGYSSGHKIWVEPTRFRKNDQQQELSIHSTRSALDAIGSELREENNRIMPGFEAEMDAIKNGTVDMSNYRRTGSIRLTNNGMEFYTERRASVSTAEGETPLDVNVSLQFRRVHDGRGNTPYAFQLQVRTASENRCIVSSPCYEQGGGTIISAEVGRRMERAVDR